MKVVAIPDLHEPYADTRKVERVIEIVYREKPDVITQLGDIMDQYVFSRFDRDLNFITPRDELSYARSKTKDFWKAMDIAAPNAAKYQILGNHDVRILKRCMSAFPAAFELLKEVFESQYTFNNVHTFKSDRDHLEIDDVIYTHGWMNKHVHHFGKSVVRAHSHRARWCHFQQDVKTDYKLLFELDLGCLADSDQLPLQYTRSKCTNWGSAVGIITDGLPKMEII